MLSGVLVFLVFVGGPLWLLGHAFAVRDRRRAAWTPPPELPSARVHLGGAPRPPAAPPRAPGLTPLETLGVVLLIAWIALATCVGAFYLVMEVLFGGLEWPDLG